MKFHVEFTYQSAEREKLLNFLHGDGLPSDGPVKVLGAWLAVQTGVGYAALETKDGQAFFELCAAWSEYGQVRVTPVIDLARV